MTDGALLLLTVRIRISGSVMMTTLLSARIRAAAPIDVMTIAISINRSFMTPPVVLTSALNISVVCIYHLITKS